MWAINGCYFRISNFDTTVVRSSATAVKITFNCLHFSWSRYGCFRFNPIK